MLTSTLAEYIASILDQAEAGHCVRVDDVNTALAPDLASALSQKLPAAAIHVLRARPQGNLDIAAERAIEIRNRKRQPCVLVVPAGEGHAASSLDNSFRRIPVLAAYHHVERLLLNRIGDQGVRELATRNRRWLRAQRQEAWTEFLAQLCVEPSEATFGRHLWMVGLVPDHAEHPGDRVERNRLAVQAISRPTRPSAAMDERFTVAGLQDGPWRGPLRRFCEQRGAQLANPRLWTQAIAEHFPELTFDKWVLAEDIAEDIDELEVVPFTRAAGTVEKWSKLKQGADGQLVLEVPEGGVGSVTVKWRTAPANVAVVASWELSVVPPNDLRTDDTEPLALTVIAGARRQGTVKVALDEDSLTDGTRFVVSVRAIGEHGESVNLTSGELAAADSQEFQIVGAQVGETKTRRTAAASVPEAVVRAALDGLDDLSEDLVSWDLDGQVFSLRLGNKRAVQVRICAPLISWQRAATARPDRPVHLRASGSHGTPLDLDRVQQVELPLPTALRRARAEFLSALAGTPHRDTVESAAWDDVLRDLAVAYGATYKRALELPGQQLDDLLRMDTVSIDVLRSNTVIRAVVVLPTHPLRAVWAATHDRVLRDWAHQLTELTPRGARAHMVDAGLVTQVVPANLPFTVPVDGALAVYTEELTFGSGLYLVPSNVDSEAAAESVASVLELQRAGSTMRASSQMVAERIQAYEAAHNPGGTLRVLAVNPGSGELLAGALREPVQVSEEEDEEDPRRLEILAYSDSPSYTHPVAALSGLQQSLRRRELARKTTHLTPPLSLSVRPVDQLKTDLQDAHLTVIQDIGAPKVEFGADPERRPAFEDLLVPIVTRSFSAAGDLVWESVPATGPAAGGSDGELPVVHRTHQRAVARLASGPDGTVPAVRVVLDGEHQARIGAAHGRSDWVIGIDRFIGVDLFESGATGAIGKSYILDYAPDFVEGIGERLTVTTANRREVELLLEEAMRDLGLAEVQDSVGGVLSTLAVVSGRLALRLLENTNHAREAVALAAVIAHLRERGDLEGLIVVPVDAHPEIFGVAARDEGAGHRCDLLLVRVSQRSFKIECIEVKSRKEARLPQMLADHIVDQLQDTKRVLQSRFFANDPPRIDVKLQLARLASILHYYADRSARHGLIAEERAAEVHRHIDRVIEGQVVPEISLRGYVISLAGGEGFKKKYGEVPLNVLTANDLGNLGFTTVLPMPSARSEPDAPMSPGLPAQRRAGNPASPTPASRPEPQPAPAHATQQPDPLWKLESQAAAKDDPRSPTEGEQSAGSDSDGASPDSRRRARWTSAPRNELPAATPAPSGSEGGEGPGTGKPIDPKNPREVETVLGVDASSSDVLWRVSTQGSPHAFIIGIPGQGKSVTTRHIIRSFADQGLPSLVFDFHGDMAADPPSGSTVLNAAEGLPFSPFEADVRVGRPINTTAWEISEIVAYVTKLGEIQRNHVYDALQAMYSARGWQGVNRGDSVPVISEFGDAVEIAEANARGRNARQRLRPMTDFGLFRDDADTAFDLLNAYRGGVVVDLSQLGLEEVQLFAASFILRKIYREMFNWPQDHTLKLAVVLDEAHRMARDVTLPKLMKEGRKYGISVIVASQSADDFHKDVLGNAGTKIVFRTNHPASRAVSGYLRGRSGLDLSVEIEKLNVGAAYVATPDHPQARRTYMRDD
ncbi:helicase HerA domain-containing protein [Microlunatus capsulatus]|uniref:helicase HerA domain-containing protein n=1 Tax=Microlunatus capsulatus TaxID=99117 RepID=UPI0031D7BBC7